jgi:RND family efflux transporter MFP subunit
VNKLLRYGWLLVVPVLVAVAGCGQSHSQGPPGPPPPAAVMVSLPVVQEVTDYEDFPGRTEAIQSVDLRARATGYLDEVNFKEGSLVEQGKVLFRIDPRTYQATLDQAKADLESKKATAIRAEALYKRTQSLVPKGGATLEDLDKDKGDWLVARANIDLADANVRTAALNLSFTEVKAPFTGRISRRYIDPGNLVKADDTVLTTIVSVGKIFAYFDLDERSTLELQGLIRMGKIVWSDDDKLPVSLGLADEKGYPRKGTINFSDNRVDPDTGTWRLRGLFDNADGVLTPGLYVRIRLPIGVPHQATLVAEQALGTDQGQRFVYVVTKEGKAEYRRVEVGRVHGGLRVINQGLKPGERVVVSGLQRVRDKAAVAAKDVPMPGTKEAEAQTQNPAPAKAGS